MDSVPDPGCNGLMQAHATLLRAERADPRGHAIHLCIALLWAFLLPMTTAGEGISWAMLASITLLRLPRIHAAYRPVWADRLWWVLVTWFAWSSLTCAWGPDQQPPASSAFPDRWLMTPLLLWPVMARPWLVLGAMAIGGALHGVIALKLSWNGSGWGSYQAFRALANISTAQWQFPATLVLCMAIMRAGHRWTRAMAGMGMIVAGSCVLLVSMRNALAAALVGSVVVLIRPVPQSRRGRRAVVAALLCVAPALAWGIARSHAWERTTSSMEDSARLSDRGRDVSSLLVGPGGRLGLMLAALEIGSEHPVLGGGAGWFAARLPQWAFAQVAADPAEYEYMRGLIESGVTHVHSTILHEWVDGGLPSIALLGWFLAGLAARLWSQSRASAVAGAGMSLLALVLTYVPFGIVTLRVPGALMAVCLAVSWLGLGYRVANPITAPGALPRSRHSGLYM